MTMREIAEMALIHHDEGQISPFRFQKLDVVSQFAHLNARHEEQIEDLRIASARREEQIEGLEEQSESLEEQSENLEE